ncbi:prolyl oligopeptidase family serine peptidase [Erythrobacter arachoides]|uniref:Prolyl oligopeptidase family serine peptidase n=1 Tax=Aurantiacibacter arachoides TaxID=1850444 RepID=A0A845A2H8_9SPHN|nr:dienelactone hydrolase family protein [Aurantiacibacter arachoides]MXO93157.1 prolyl oligopeptidase family serine peptidase [Aurantiacibacter arachoides]GGD51609.1 dienelactone hydrolase [Aurantiacibacter arachoides]
MTAEPIAYADGETSLTGHLYRPAGNPRAAVLVFPTIMNPTPAVEAKARALAEAGYLALVADFYGKRPGDLDAARQFALEIRHTPLAYRQRLRAALRALVAQAPDLPICVIGFCMGGQAALELARDGAPVAAVVSFHGLLDTQLPAEPGTVTARILVCHGDADPMVPRGQVLKFWEEMDRAGADWHFHSYAGVRHGFTNPAPTENPATGYDASADRQSWAAMLSLFDEILA